MLFSTLALVTPSKLGCGMLQQPLLIGLQFCGASKGRNYNPTKVIWTGLPGLHSTLWVPNLGTASFDKTWRLWDVSTGIELLLREKHSRGVSGIAFQQDGALAASCGMDASARVWDLQTGKSILALEGHVKSISQGWPAHMMYGMDFSPSGYHSATGSDDHTCRVWDLRKRQCLYIIPAHNILISRVKFKPSESYLLIWLARDFKTMKTLAGRKSEVAGVDV